MTDLAVLKSWIPGAAVDGSQDDALNALIERNSGVLLNLLGRSAFLSGSVTERRNGNGSAIMMLRTTPVTAVASLSVEGIAVAASVDARAPGYVFDDSAIYLIGDFFPRGIQNVSVTYTAGYAIGSAEQQMLEQACLALCTRDWKRRDHSDMTSRGLATAGATAFDSRDLPQEVERVVMSLRRVAVTA